VVITGHADLLKKDDMGNAIVTPGKLDARELFAAVRPQKGKPAKMPKDGSCQCGRPGTGFRNGVPLRSQRRETGCRERAKTSREESPVPKTVSMTQGTGSDSGHLYWGLTCENRQLATWHPTR
jgi:hypothetical protein